LAKIYFLTFLPLGSTIRMTYIGSRVLVHLYGQFCALGRYKSRLTYLDALGSIMRLVGQIET